MWECNDCHEEFETPSKEKMAFETYYGVSNLFQDRNYFDLLTCPHCGSEDIEELKTCDICGEYNREEDLEDTEGAVNGGIGYLCPQCIQDCEVGM